MRRLPALDYSLQSTECPVVVHAAEVAWELGISTLRFNFRGVGLGKLYPPGGAIRAWARRLVERSRDRAPRHSH